MSMIRFVVLLRSIESKQLTRRFQFSIFLYYPADPNRSHPLTVILRAAILSVHSRPVRYVVRGTKGTFYKHGVDVQEDQLRVIADPTSIHESGFGREPGDIHGIVENLQAGGQIVNNRQVSTPISALSKIS